ncbi:hypothetical protein [Lichenibacterium dinghuense]|uniref:hypothetical protein n=1 Tax=Lichenibacterium dinghuense TaxID=2895977 RepID=UPI001F1C4A2C|nr:hypothetical protein [Lichenibacterium sp. 6Y81]
MLFRRSASLVEAIHLDGTEAATRAAAALPRAAARARAETLEVSTAYGRRVARRGDWITRDVATQSIRLYGDERFQATHEAVA